ncbi:acyl-CoA thioester hydrolase YciA [Klebsiella oxytoca]|nr:acyl-CoA thioester hydrolase YciA [Klebsiella oxytoca]HAT1583208.1 acyl-CoA thioester hydrolase YciA [Raoultella ornithinolytica]
MKIKNECPEGELVLRTLAMPSDANASGDIFGGWIMSQMDIGGGIFAKEIANGRVVTAAVNNIVFIRPVAVGNIICCYAKITNIGHSSISINIELWAKSVTDGHISKRVFVTEAIFVYVAVDENNRPRNLSMM